MNRIKNINNWERVECCGYRFYINKYDYFEILHLNDNYHLYILNVFGREFVTSQSRFEDCITAAYYTYIQLHDTHYEFIEPDDWKNGKYTVYKHVSPQEKIYIGCTSQTTSSRWSNGYGYKMQPSFYNDIVRIGWNNFEHSIIAHNLNEQDGYALEKTLILNYKTNFPDSCYNIAFGGKGAPGVVKSEDARRRLRDASSGEKHPFYGKHLPYETRMRIRESTLGEKNHFYGKKHKPESIQKFVENNPRRRPVICIETGVIYDSVRQAGRSNNIDAGTISKACHDSRHIKSAGGYHWKYAK